MEKGVDKLPGGLGAVWEALVWRTQIIDAVDCFLNFLRKWYDVDTSDLETSSFREFVDELKKQFDKEFNPIWN